MKFFLTFIFLLILITGNNLSAQQKKFFPGKVWNDTKGEPINAHGGGLLLHNSLYYWFGEIKKGKTFRVERVTSWEDYRVNAGGISCYSSKDLINWKNEGVALPPNTKDPSNDLHTSKVIERPKVIYNKKTGKFVMWVHLDNEDYSHARSGVAVSDKPAGPYHFISSEKPNGNDARDMTIFQDDDGRAYHFYSSEGNATMHITLLSDDYLHHTKTEKKILINNSREAPAVIKYNNKYFLFSSACTGWAPNAASYTVADNIMGEWKQYDNPCTGPDSAITYLSQSTYVIKVPGKNDAFIFLADKWNKTDLPDSRYIWLPMTITNGKPQITWADSWNFSFFK
jgi:Glycosyl hydrolases family 43